MALLDYKHLVRVMLLLNQVVSEGIQFVGWNSQSTSPLACRPLLAPLDDNMENIWMYKDPSCQHHVQCRVL
jgi:hypothetical protein